MKIKTFSFARKDSQRCNNKMLKKFYNTTLVDIILEKLQKINSDSFFAGYEEEFKKKSLDHNVDFIQRSKESANVDEPITEILSFLKDVDADYFVIVNACLPLLRIDTINKFLDFCEKNNHKPTFAIHKISNYFLDNEKNPLNFDSDLKTINTKVVKPVYQFTHALYFFEKKFFFDNGKYWNWKDLNYFEIENNNEIIDIDTEQDFKKAEIIYKNLDND